MPTADIYILINSTTLEIYEGCMSTNDLKIIGTASSLEEAIQIAEEFEERLLDKETCLEYGLFFAEKLRGYEINNAHSNKNMAQRKETAKDTPRG